ncbi:MAG: beta-galactosidase [Chthoniobacterales bacterium]
MGVSIRVGWATIEPTEGVFSWTYLDSEIGRATAAGKIVMLRISTQTGKPAWVTTAIKNSGGKFFQFIDAGVPSEFPVYWDPVFLAKKKALIAAVGARYGNNPTVKIVTASFANATSEDWSVPHETADVTQWLSLGYTTAKLLDAGNQMIDATMAAFPTAFVTVAINGNGHTGQGPNLDPDSDYVARNVALTAEASWPGRFIIQKNSLSTFNPASPGTGSNWEVVWDNAPRNGAQMLYWVANETTYRMNGGVKGDPATVLHNAINAGLSYGLRYLEIYQTDIINYPAETTYAKNALSGQPTPTPTPKPSATPTPTPPSAPNPPTGLKIVK